MGDTLVLCYHAVSAEWEAPLSTTPERFEAQLARLARRGYRATTVSEALSAGGDGRVVAITFDDAFRSVLELAAPILARFEMVATVYAPTGFIGSGSPMSWPEIDRWRGGPRERELLPLAWDELRDLVGRGWEVGSHTVTHARLPELGPAELKGELEESKAVCEREIGRSCASIAYPYGDHDRAVVEAAGAAGYEFGLTLPARLHAATPLRWPRVGVYYRDDLHRFALKTSPAIRRVRSLLGAGS
jgi:peptidoglycan/xylan/chitin deacetylase (PgdA/CDA1 family)